MSILDQALETGDPRYPTHNEEFVLMHVDSVEATGFISHLKLPHYVTFQSKLNSVKENKKRRYVNERQLSLCLF
jgi:alpha-D-ribose 1-methylphosphonate 5-triphosphate synthase subunit PhnI